jgi:hypothetical protein
VHRPVPAYAVRSRRSAPRSCIRRRTGCNRSGTNPQSASSDADMWHALLLPTAGCVVTGVFRRLVRGGEGSDHAGPRSVSRTHVASLPPAGVPRGVGVNAGFVTGDAWSSLATPSSGSPGSSRPRTCAARGNRPPSRAGSPREGPPRLSGTSARRSPAGPVRRNPASPAPGAPPRGRRTAARLPAATPAKNRQRPRLKFRMRSRRVNGKLRGLSTLLRIIRST